MVKNAWLMVLAVGYGKTSMVVQDGHRLVHYVAISYQKTGSPTWSRTGNWAVDSLRLPTLPEICPVGRPKSRSAGQS